MALVVAPTSRNAEAAATAAAIALVGCTTEFAILVARIGLPALQTHRALAGVRTVALAFSAFTVVSATRK